MKTVKPPNPFILNPPAAGVATSQPGLTAPMVAEADPTAAAMDDFAPAMPTSVPTAQRGAVPYFKPDSPVLRGDDDTEDEKLQVHVGAQIPASIRDQLGYDVVRVRTKGIRTRRDIEHALAYLTWLMPGLVIPVRAIREEGIPIELGPPGLTYSYARPTFGGMVNRNAPDYGKKIVVERGATPEVLLHEIMHVLPLGHIRTIASLRHGAIFSHIPEPPAVNPRGTYQAIRQAILENIRIGETISFGSECLVYDMERDRNIQPVFHSPMMSYLDDAWRNATGRGWDAIRATFPQYLPHYEERLGFSTILLALIVKVEGRTELTDEEFEIITKGAKGDIPFKQFVTYFQRYLDRYVQEKGLDVSPEFFSLEQVIRRTSLVSVSIDTLAQVVESVFMTLEELEKRKSVEDLPPPAKLEEADIPPAASHGDRTSLFVAYSGVVDRFLENPPPSLSREELSSLVSYVRMAPPDAAIELASRLNVYLGAGFEDLRVTLGLILYEKGFHRRGRELVSDSLDLKMLPELLPHVKRIMGPQVVASFIRTRTDEFRQKMESFARGFHIWAMGQLMWFGGPWEETARQLFEFPELFSANSWREVGQWIYDCSDDVDSHHSEFMLFSLWDTELGERIDKYRKEGDSFIRMLSRLRADARLDGMVKEAVDEAWHESRDRLAAGFSALGKLVELGEESSLVDEAITKSLGLYEDDELAAIFGGLSSELKARAITLAQLHNDRPWSYPDEVERMLETLRGAIPEKGSVDGDALGRLLGIIDANGIKGNPLDVRGIVDELFRVAKKNMRSSQVKLGDTLRIDEWAPLGFAHDLRCVHHRQYDTPFDSLFFESLACGLLARAVRLAPSDKVPRYFDEALRFLSNTLKDNVGREGYLESLDNILAPYAAYFLMQANERGLDAYADRFLEFMFREIPLVYPPDERFVYEAVDGSEEKLTFGEAIPYLRHVVAHEWTLRMETARVRALRDRTVDLWLNRLRDEIGRGSDTITINALHFFADNMIGDGHAERLEDLYRLMIVRSLMQPTGENVGETMRAIQESPLDDPMKDDLLEGFVARLVEMATAFRGIDLTIIRRLQGLFPWRTPFMRANDIPHYPRTEGLVIEKLADIPELVEPGRGKDDRVRLAAFSAAGLPLQRYARWTAELFTDPWGPAELKNMGLQKDYWEIYRDLDLPHPYTIPGEYATEEVMALLRRDGEKIRPVLVGGDADQAHAVVRLMGRIMGSELRYILGSQGERDESDSLFKEREEGPREYIDILESSMAVQVLEWMKRQYSAEERSPHLDVVQEMFFAAGPREVRRLGQAREMLAWPMSRDEKRHVFERATRHLVFSTRMRRRLEAIRGDAEGAEMNLYGLLLGIHYEFHPGTMVSNFLLTRLEADKSLREEYGHAVAGKGTGDPLLLAEVGLSRVEDVLTRLHDKTKVSIVERLELVLNAHRFLRTYMEISNDDDYCDGFYFQFKRRIVMDNIDRFRHYFEDATMERPIDASGVEGYNEVDVDIRLREFSEVLSEAGLAERISTMLDRMGGQPVVYRDGSEIAPKKADEFINAEVEALEQTIARIEGLHRRVIIEELEDRLLDIELPGFIEEREGLERELLIWVMESLNPSQREILNRELEAASSHEDRLLALGRAAHLEKLMQLASIHPAVPPRYQKLFSIFQEDVPHRDHIDVQRSIDMGMDKEDRAAFKLGKPIKEGTIGGVYEATYEGKDIVLKIIPAGKEIDIRDSLRLVRDVRRFLWASDYARPGGRATDDLLSFYDRTIQNEIALYLEEENARALIDVLPDGATVPASLKEPRIDGVVSMAPLYSKRLKELGPKERAAVFHRMDDELIPAMLGTGVIHYDLHPGNIGVTDDGTIVLYDMGRVVRLSAEEHSNLMSFYDAVQARKVEALLPLLRKMGTVRDEEAFSTIGELIGEMISADDPLATLEEMYPKLADYGYVLGDNYIKVLLMFITWRGTKKTFSAD